MLLTHELLSLRANQRFLAAELQSRGIEISVLDWANEVLVAKYGEHSEIFLDIDSSIMPYAASTVASSKSITRELLARNGVIVPRGARFGVLEQGAVLAFAELIGFPIVVKPSVGSQGKDVYLDLTSAEEISHALDVVAQSRGDIEVLVEEHFEAKEYRVFVTKAGSYAAVYREPAFVIGNGTSSVRQLALEESLRRLNPRLNCLGELVLDAEAERHLRKQGLTLDFVPQLGEKIYLRKASNVSLGGVAEDVTETVHESVLEICLQALDAVPGLPYAGIDFMTKDISCAQSSSSYRILELNPLPGIGIHMAPGRGKPRNVAAMLADLIFPESVGSSSMFNEISCCTALKAA